jgi:branched-chain amino acid transport system ATP-binding protein
MTVRENLLLGGYTCARRELEGRLARVYEWFPRLAERTQQMAGSLSGGEQQMVAIARGLMTQPALLMLDEPSLGLAPKLVLQVGEMIQAIRQRGITVMLVEQNARLALELADRAYVLQTGRIALEGASRDVRDHPDVRAAYLGL